MEKELLSYVKKELELAEDSIYLLDSKKGDVTGDGIEDKIYLIGNKEDDDAIFAENIILVVQNGATGRYIPVSLETNAGYGSRLFIGDFTKDGISDVKVSIDSGGSGGVAYYYIYSFNSRTPELIFDFEEFNQKYEYEVNYRDFYKVEVINKTLEEIFIIDISDRDAEYLSEIYYADGTLKEPVEGDVLPLGGLFPIVRDGREKKTIYDLFAIQRIIGRYNADGLGYTQTFLTWDQNEFISTNFEVALLGQEIDDQIL